MSAGSQQHVRRCYYDILNVPRDAEKDVIRRSFFGLAREWHPDKNPHRVAEATERFKEIQEANGVLSDPHERSWYDQHREAILRGRDGTNAEPDPEFGDLTVLWPYLSKRCFRDFSTEPQAFYGVYSSLFNALAEEENRYRSFEDQVTEPPAGLPRFGGPEEAWPEVRHFYDVWANYVSKMTFAWCDEYDTRDAPNRLTRRWAERENKKQRNAARRKRVEEIRQLVTTVRSFDPRVQAHNRLVQEEREAERMRREEARRRRREEAARRAEERQDEWEAEVEAYHEELERDAGFRLADEHADELAEAAMGPHLDAGAAEEAGEEAEAETEDLPPDMVDEMDQLAAQERDVKLAVEILRDERLPDDQLEEALLDMGFSEDTIHRVLSAASAKGADSEPTDRSREPDRGHGEGDRGQDEPGKAHDKGDSHPLPPASSFPETGDVPSTQGPEKEAKNSSSLEDDRTARRRARRAQRKAKKERAEGPDVAPGHGDGFVCVACAETFPSKSKLHQHLKRTGHALPPTAIATLVDDGKGAGGKKGKRKGKKGSRRRGGSEDSP